MTIRRRVPKQRNPYYSNVVGGASMTIGAETSNAIIVTVQLKDNQGVALTQRGAVTGWLSSDATGDTPLLGYNVPSGGYAVSSAGTVQPGQPAADALIQKGTLVIDAVPEKFKTTTTALYRVGGYPYSKAAATAILFTAAHVVTASKFAVVLIQVNAAGTVSTKVPATTQAYNSAALALAALPAPDAGKVALGYIAIAAKAATWTANTDDLTNGSDLTTAAFVDNPENGSYGAGFVLTSNAAGVVDVAITETRVANFYMNLRLPDGSIVSSAVIPFA